MTAQNAFWTVATVVFGAGCGGKATVDSSSSEPTSSDNWGGGRMDTDRVSETAQPNGQSDNQPGMPARTGSDCSDWVIDDFDGGAMVETQWGYWDAPETDGVSMQEPLPELMPANDSQRALRVAVDFAQPTSIDVLTHFHSMDPRGFSALTFRARAASEAPSVLTLAVAGSSSEA